MDRSLSDRLPLSRSIWVAAPWINWCSSLSKTNFSITFPVLFVRLDPQMVWRLLKSPKRIKGNCFIRSSSLSCSIWSCGGERIYWLFCAKCFSGQLLVILVWYLMLPIKKKSTKIQPQNTCRKYRHHPQVKERLKIMEALLIKKKGASIVWQSTIFPTVV